MYITLISACEKRALKRTRAVLDSYAIRIGARTWGTPITHEGLQEMRTLLRRSATRQTAVACYRNQGAARMTLLWIVGARSRFGPTGHYPAGTRRSARRTVPTWVRAACLLAQAAGLGHDLGKTGVSFTGKLRYAVNPSGQRPSDPVRHEWLSMRLLQGLRVGQGIDEAWASLKSGVTLKTLSSARSKSPRSGLSVGMLDAGDALDYLVGTHHKLFGPLKGLGRPDSSRHADPNLRVNPQPAALPPSILIDDLQRTLERLVQCAGPSASPEFWRGLATLARAALILADHEVSSWKMAGQCRKDPYAMSPMLYANTHKDQETGRIACNQPLGWHLDQVSRIAADRAYRIATLRLPALSAETVERLLIPADRHGPFAWQNRAIEAARQLAEHPDPGPILVLNIAGTGTGKTRLNAQIACTLNPRPRFAVALNLRTLTLQTGDALRALGIGDDELATVIGDRVAEQLHEWQSTALNLADEEDEDAQDRDYEAVGGEVELPDWMNHLLRRRPRWKSILGAPVLVSTIDFLVNAGEPGRQGNHVAALLRLADSDLVLDEIDGYEPQALVAVLRLIQAAALCGRHVICSSATLATPIAHAVQQAFSNGVRMRAALEQRALTPMALIVNDRSPPAILTLDAEVDFQERYRDYTQCMIAALPTAISRWPYLQRIDGCSETAWRNDVLAAVTRLHGAHAWPFRDTGKRVSFGLVRVANIRTAIALARFLAEQLPHARIACYHSQDILIQRFHKERRLDWLLTRSSKQSNERIEKDPEIRALVAQSSVDHVPFIVVATPVEEVGRDHDFDWGVLEPSGTHSLIQPGGRVNRHRNWPVTEPNIAILQFNARCARGESIVFCQPGLEVSVGDYDSHDLDKLLDWTCLTSLDARLRFSGEHRFAQCDEKILEKRLSEPMAVLCADPGYASAWMTEGFYRKYPLREDRQQDEWRLVIDSDGHEAWEMYKTHRGQQGEWLRRNLASTIKPVSNDWLTLSKTEMDDLCRSAGIKPESGLRLTIDHRGTAGDLIWDQSFGFTMQY